MIINLTNNAIKFTEKGEVTVALTRRSDNGHALTEICVSDTGIGIQPENQVKLFQAFTQLESTTSMRRYEGTGLGLHLSQKLANLLGAHITMQSEYGKGSTFTLVVPER